MALFFFTFSYLTAVILEDKIFKSEEIIKYIDNDFSESELAIKDALCLEKTRKSSTEVQQSIK